MEQLFSGTTGQITRTDGAVAHVFSWTFSATTGVPLEWSGSFVTSLEDALALWEARTAVEAEFVDELGATWTGLILTDRVPDRPGLATVSFQAVGEVRRNGVVHRPRAF